jgi:hypothetical protein
MNTSEKSTLMSKLRNELLGLAMGHGDAHPMVTIQIVDTDPEPMSGPFAQASCSFRFLLPQDPEK